MDSEMLNQDFPRILVVNSQNLNKNNATGITLRSILSLIPKDKLLQIYRFNPWNPAPDIMNIKSIQIPPTAMPIAYLFKKVFGAVTDEDRPPSNTNNQEEKKSIANLDIIKVLFKAMLDVSIISPDKSFLSKVDAFKPELIYTLGGELCIQKWALYFAKRYKCRVVMHYMDNWRQTAYLKDKCLSFINNYLNKQLGQLEQRMKCGVVISDAMATAYKKIYHHEYLPLMNIVNNIIVKNVEHEYLTIVYAGGLHLNRYKTLLAVEKCVRHFSDVKLVIFTSKDNIVAYQNLFDNRLTTFKESVEHDKIAMVFECADILLHIESFEARDVEYTKYSLSTKIPEYMMSGKPIICYAPPILAASQYIKSSCAGISVSTSSEFIEAVRLFRDKNTRNDYGRRGIETAKKNHSPESSIRVLRQVFMLEE